MTTASQVRKEVQASAITPPRGSPTKIVARGLNVRQVEEIARALAKPAAKDQTKIAKAAR